MTVSLNIPASTYRLQLNKSFTFEEAAELTGYLYELGISHCYTSPLTLARAGSMHGYDVTDQSRLNPEIGTEEQFAKFAQALDRKGMGVVLDVVPNHMCISDPSNRWWFDVLENGRSSPYASYFDIDWDPPKANLTNKVLLPVLGDQFGRVLEKQRIKVVYTGGAFEAHFSNLRLPLEPRSWASILGVARNDLATTLGEADATVTALESIVTAIGHLPLPNETDPDRVRERQREKR